MKKQPTASHKTDLQVLPKANWNLLDTKNLQLRYNYGNSVVAEFVLEHDHVAVLRELVQNEYDAGGSQLKVAFGTDELRITGNGNPIDTAGWKRLSVMLGTGQIGGLGSSIEQKVNGIGSKNFGLRSLFLYGDQIYIRSGGLQTVLDYFDGTLQDPEPEPHSKHLQGIEIVVPYRVRKNKDLDLFDIAREKQALDSFATGLTFILMKLAQPDAPKSLRRVEISSIRCGRFLMLRQSVKVISQQKGIFVVLRTIHLDDSEPSPSQVTGRGIKEIEFQKVISLPSQFRGQMIPGYYKVPGGRIRLAVSLRKNRKKIDFEQPSHFFYPLAATKAYTGNAISINAPFRMNTDRSEIINPNMNLFNQWLIDRTVDLVFDLLVSDWRKEFGPERYLVLQEQTLSGSTYFSKQVANRLAKEACWPTRAREKGSPKRSQLATAAKIVVPTSSALDGYLSDSNYLDDTLGNDPRIRIMVKKCGVQTFDISSLVRLRCAGADATHLATQLTSGVANYRYTNFPDELKEESLQQRFARAFDALASQLSKQNREDLKKSPTTLAADGSLQAPEKLWVVDPTIASVCPLLASEQLHTSLIECKTLVGLCHKYDAKKWIQKTTQQVQDGTASEEQRTALYKFVLEIHGRLDRTTWAMLRKAPVLRDHRNEWVAANAITLRKAIGASKLEEALHFPHPDYENDNKLADALRFKKKLTGEDLVRYAHIVARAPDLALEFEETLWRFHRILTKPELERLKTIAFLQSSQGSLASSSALYLHTSHNVACLGDNALFVAGSRITLYKYLGCMDQPKAKDIVAFLDNLRLRDARPKQPEILYPALVEALQVKKNVPTLYKDYPIIWDGRGYSKPVDMLLGRKYRASFLQSVPLFEEASPVLQQALKLLGVPSAPQPQHWQKLFIWFNQRYAQSETPLSQTERQVLLNAYCDLLGMPSGVADDIKYLLDQNGRLHSRAEIRAKQYLLDDDPDLAQALMKNGTSPTFANTSGPQPNKLIRFYRVVGVSSLTEVREKIGFNIGAEKKPPPWCDSSKVIERLHDRFFLSALTSLAAYQLQEYPEPPIPPLPQLQAISSLVFAQLLHIEYRVGNITVQVPTDIVLDHERLVLVEPQSSNELDELVSQAIATLFVNIPVGQRQFANAIYRVLTSATISEMANYLRRQGIPWEPPVSLPELEIISLYDEFGDPASNVQIEPEIAEATFNDELTRDSQIVQEVIKSSITRSIPYNTASYSTLSPESKEQDIDLTKFSSRAIMFPPIESIKPVSLEPLGNWSLQDSRPGGSGRKSWGTPSVSVDEERNREIGQRGEEIIFLHEIERIKRWGYPKSRVVWIAKETPLADYDILSVDENGRDLWLEVKSTTGRHGHFKWSIAELKKAIQEREQYILWRVYEVNTIYPSIKPFRDPVGMIIHHSIQLDIASLSAEIEPLRVPD